MRGGLLCPDLALISLGKFIYKSLNHSNISNVCVCLCVCLCVCVCVCMCSIL